MITNNNRIRSRGNKTRKPSVTQQYRRLLRPTPTRPSAVSIERPKIATVSSAITDKESVVRTHPAPPMKELETRTAGEETIFPDGQFRVLHQATKIPRQPRRQPDRLQMRRSNPEHRS